ncbi:MAG: hypothetical protein H6822_26755 [Planctomycetaceae bacterium]|nr:hypothetical protein [Planctomycetales bacterium]MCB9925780.1 hypothetical protein [Planctomycetaceae bacterium]
MNTLAARRTRNLGITIVAALLILWLSDVMTTALRDVSRLSGWGLLAMVAFLAAYNVRKKLAFLPLGSSSSWLQLHVYVGLLTAVVFGIHISWKMPSGLVEMILAALYLYVFASGLVGLFLTRSLPKRLTTRGDEILFERIPVYRKRIQAEVEAIVFSGLDDSESTAIAQFYADRLRPFFTQPRNLWQHLVQSNRARFGLLNEMRAYGRYLDNSEREMMSRIATCVERKDDLDYQFSLQATLKYWLFVHVPLSYGLLVFAVVHLLLVSAFSGGAS